ncbi:YcaO-like family protein [Rubrobacter indicoceani]|uniref:YcaO-like family protein n=1 Tax=Rubrobacter indicoceani TaxID=2051957 RepID=UPI000E5B1214|nr:YcaO-like family protein [Rubrobacter indicoceani]
MSGERSLGEVAEAYRASLGAGEVMEFPVSGLDHTGVPVHTVAVWPESGAGKGPFCNGVGYGNTADEARVSAFGECVESVGAWKRVQSMKRVRASRPELVRQYGERAVMDPVLGGLPAGSGYTPQTELDWVQMRRWPDGSTVLAPVEFVATRGADLPDDAPEPLFTPITNGLGAGLDPERAVSHAVMEILQRDGNGLAFRALDRGIGVDLEGLEDAAALELLSRLDDEGIDVTVKLAATDFGLANVYAVGEDRYPSRAMHPLSVTACGEACHPDRGRAVRKAVAEFCASRARKPFNHGPLAPIEELAPTGYVERFRRQPLSSEEDRSLDATLGWLDLGHDGLRGLVSNILTVRETVALTALPTTTAGTPEETLGIVLPRLRKEGYEVLYADIAPSEDVRAVKVIVPGLEVETLSYGRIGARNLARLLERDIGLVGLGAPPKDRPGTKRILLTEEQKSRFGGPAWFDYRAANAAVGELYPLYREPGRHVAALAKERGAL